MVKEISSEAEYKKEIASGGLVVVDWFATWCGPCVGIAPFLESLSQKYKDVKFLKVDVDKCQDIASQNSVRAMPTFFFILNGNKVDELQGANPTELEAKLLKVVIYMLSML